ncbi:MAG TPA: hypothetical protein VF177_14445, partial [Anaerolineae bacterium]
MPSFWMDRGRLPPAGTNNKTMEKTQVAAEAAMGETGRLRTAKKKVLPALVKIGISAGLIYWILQGTDLGEVFAAA